MRISDWSSAVCSSDLTDPAVFGTLMRMVEEATIAHLAAQIEAGAEVVQLFDTWAGVLPEAAMRRWCLDPCRRIATAVAAENPDVPVIVFPRGVGTASVAYAEHGALADIGIAPAMPAGWAGSEVQPSVPVPGNLAPRELRA